MKYESFIRKGGGPQPENLITVSFPPSFPDYYKKAYLKSRGILDSRPGKDFMERFNYGDFEADIAKLKDKERRIKNRTIGDDFESKAISEICEAMVFDFVNQGIFGPDTNMALSCIYDDYFNGVDMIMVHKLRGQQGSQDVYSGISVDVASGERAFESKIDAIKDRLSRGLFQEIKYFVSRDESFKGTLSKRPQFVLGFKKEDLRQIAIIWSNSHAAPSEVKNIVRDYLLDQLISQCKEFASVSKEASDIYKKELQLLEYIKNHIKS